MKQKRSNLKYNKSLTFTELPVMRKRSFTLIELLVVITIIGILSSLVLVSLNAAKSKARDARRKSNLATIKNALEMYYLEYGGYPSSAYPQVDYIIPHSLALEPKMSQFLPSFPTDPQNNPSCYASEYLYLSNTYYNPGANNASATTYALYASLENQSQTNLDPNNGADVWLRDNFNCIGNRRVNYKVVNL